MQKILRASKVLILGLSLIAPLAKAQSGVHPSQDRADNPASVTIPAGTLARVELQNSLHSKINEVGDEVQGILESSVIVNGVVALKKGTEIQGHITHVSAAKRPQHQATMAILFDKIIIPSGEQEVETMVKAIDDFASETKRNADDEGRVKGGHSGGKTVDNAIKGGVLGSIVGLPIILVSGPAGVSAPLGGAAAGVLLSKGNDIKLSPGTVFRIEFTKPVTIPTNNDK